MSIAKMPPNSRNTRPAHKNCLAMYLWSIEKTYRLRKFFGSTWMCCRCWAASMSARVITPSMSVAPLVGGLALALPLPPPVRLFVLGIESPCGRSAHRLRPAFEIVRLEHAELGLHLVVVDAAVLRAADLELAGLLRHEPQPVDH